MLVNINFGGFYESIHDDIVEERVAYNFGFDDSDTGEIDSEKTWYITKEIWDYAKEKYARDYVCVLNNIFGTDIKFDYLFSPHCYNFSTDIITADISRADCLKLIKYLKSDNINLKPKLYQLVKDCTTSRSGYISFHNYSDYFKKDNIAFLFECILDVLIERESEDYPVMVEDFWVDIPETVTDEDGYIFFKDDSEVA